MNIFIMYEYMYIHIYICTFKMDLDCLLAENSFHTLMHINVYVYKHIQIYTYMFLYIYKRFYMG
jgi:hypothetical protein